MHWHYEQIETFKKNIVILLSKPNELCQKSGPICDSVFKKEWERKLRGWLEPVVFGILATIGLDHVERVGVTWLGGTIGLAFMQHLTVNQY